VTKSNDEEPVDEDDGSYDGGEFPPREDKEH
jgi:hypothetical protein